MATPVSTPIQKRTVKLATRYDGYLVETPCAVDDFTGLDLEETCMHYWSSGALDPIEPAGIHPRYAVRDVEIPEWFIAGLQKMVDEERLYPPNGDVLLYAARIIVGHAHMTKPEDFGMALKHLIFTEKPSGFHLSLMGHFAENGWLSEKQIYSVVTPFWKQRRNRNY